MNGNTQKQTPIVQAIETYIAKNRQRQHMPGHKGQPRALGLLQNWGELAAWDVTEAEGLDDLHAPDGAIKQAAELMAAAVGAEQAYLLVGGASVGILAAILAVTAAAGPNCQILLPRNAHRSVWNGLALAGCQPVWLPVQYGAPDCPPLGVTPRQLRAACAAHPECQAAFFVYPSFYGVCVDLPEMLSICQHNQLISIVDEAHGAHLPFTAPEHAASRLGADLIIDSWHKSMGSLGQTAVLLDNISARRTDVQPERWLSMLQTTSPSYPLLASLDAARAAWCEQAAARRKNLRQERAVLAEALQKTQILRLYAAEELPAGFSYDDTKALLYSNAGHSGWQLAAALRQAGIEPEFADWRWALLLLSYADALPDNGFSDLLAALRQADKLLQQTPPRALAAELFNADKILPPLPRQILPPAQAVRQPVRYVPLQQAAGQVAAGLLTPYPPGIPWLGPGELIEPEHIAAAGELLKAGGRLQGLRDNLMPIIDYA